MKKFVLFIGAALLIGGMAWGQVTPPPDLQNFNAVGTISTEARYSMGLFDSDVDNFIDAQWHDAAIGNFLFMGGFPSNGTNVDVTDTDYNGPVDGPGVANPQKYTISLGYGKTLGEGSYIAAYYAGKLLEGNGGNADEHRTSAETTWTNNFAFLYGTKNMGFRFDLIMDEARSSSDTYDGKVYDGESDGDLSIALTWGGVIKEVFASYATVGFLFPNETKVTTDQPLGADSPDKSATMTTGAMLGVRAGFSYDSNPTSSISVDVGFDIDFGTAVTGDSDIIGEDPYTAGGAFNVALNAAYTKSILFGNEEIGITTLKLSPNVDIAFASESTSKSTDSDKSPSNDAFYVSPGIDLGIEYKYQKIGLYSGLGLRFLTYTANWHTGGATKNESSEWEITGITFENSTLRSNGSIGIGMTFAPIDGLVFGISLTSWMGNIFNFNPRTMQFTNANANPNTALNWTNAVDITVSYRF